MVNTVNASASQPATKSDIHDIMQYLDNINLRIERMINNDSLETMNTNDKGNNLKDYIFGRTLSENTDNLKYYISKNIISKNLK
jgi:hypothetical protein